MASFDLTNRVPENKENQEYLHEYLEVASEVSSDFSDSIKLHDTYKDYKKIPSYRLDGLASRYNFNRHPLLPEDTFRSIMRDMTKIYSTNSTGGAVEWAFRILGWDVKVEEAWLIDPHKYLPSIVSPTSSVGDVVVPKMIKFSNSVGRSSYIMGDSNQIYAQNEDWIIYGSLLIGENMAGDPAAIEKPERSYFYDHIDYRNFVYGEAYDYHDGTYFNGRTHDSMTRNRMKLKIVNENYSSDHDRSDQIVMSTPYIAITILEQSFSNFLLDYNDEGLLYEYSPLERYNLVEYLLNYILFDLIRPSPVKILFLGEHIGIESPPIYIRPSSFDIERIIMLDPVDFTLAPQCASNILEEITTSIKFNGDYAIEETGQQLASNSSYSKPNTEHMFVGLNTFYHDDAGQTQQDQGIYVEFDGNQYAEGVKIYRGTSASTLSLIREMDSTSDGFLDTNVDVYGVTYYYRIDIFFMDINVKSTTKSVFIQCCPLEPFTLTDITFKNACALTNFSISNATVEKACALTNFSISNATVT